ncbi:hypothetical protein GCM10007989_10280 [Devosia pacifica]|uniref:Nickel/cobalt efflux system n=1 Tax=Devosia pacifica TaxID=1335967 RepID=A0A918VRS2_9HYPH|nr:DUF1007 family protein [Devosia pacifica]GHA17023.1 hypothetical protein GCM10007989_10280 [Devosia pacifica]
MSRSLKALFLCGLFCLFACGRAAAHPHIFIDATLNVKFDEAGRVSRLDHAWTFDPYFSSWIVQGLDANGDGVTSPDELQPLANENLVGLAEYGFYTFATVDDRQIEFSAAGEAGMRYDSDQVTLRFSVVPDTPVAMADGPVELAISDDEYYVAITFEDEDSITLEDAPASCEARLRPPQPLSSEIEQQLFSLGADVRELPPELAAAVRGTQGTVLVFCGNVPAASTALEAATEVAERRPAPFGGPPVEPSLGPTAGALPWLREAQRDFYAAMTSALGSLRADPGAFWLLGGLSFLYGVVHAAGPGHGKLVISSYALASTNRVRRGILLSFVSALVQALVAIAFVLIAVAVLGLTGTALGDASGLMITGSYLLVALLGAWLVIRHVMGWGHRHSEETDLAAKAHAHLHDQEEQKPHDHHHDHDHHGHHHDHHHIVPPDAADKSWREQLGLVLAVGLRPCSGALVVLVFALSQGLLAAGIAATLLMGLGTGITVAVLAVLAVSAKGLAARFAGASGSKTAARLVWWLELVGALMVFGLGAALLVASV